MQERGTVVFTFSRYHLRLGLSPLLRRRLHAWSIGDQTVSTAFFISLSWLMPRQWPFEREEFIIHDVWCSVLGKQSLIQLFEVYQSTIVMSTFHSEMYALVEGAQMAVYLARLLRSMKFAVKFPVAVLGDNESTLAAASVPQTKQGRHLNLRAH
jgi:hypothetical protein